MIIRARPKNLEGIDFKDLDDNPKVGDNEFYFNSGRAALKFYLEYLNLKKGRKIVIAMQAFNCRVVLDAAIESGCIVYLLDIKLVDFSISQADISELIRINDIDVLLLTHYQGIPNLDYEKIITLCNKSNIILIEDMAHVYGTKINGIEIGTLGDVTVYSFAFDKPFTCLQGGMLKINSNLENIMVKKYEGLPAENFGDASMDIKVLQYLYRYTNRKYYKKGIDNIALIKILLKARCFELLIYRILTIRLVSLAHKFFVKLGQLLQVKSQNKIEIRKLDSRKISLIKLQQKNYCFDGSRINWIKKICDKFSIKYFENSNTRTFWNRFSVIDDQNILKEFLLSAGYQVGNFNWPITLDQLALENKSVYIFGSLENSCYASKYILNIPIWNFDDK
jgi:hypothetical protein